MLHTLRLQQPYFDAVADGSKTFEIRREYDGRRFEIGDVLVLVEYDASERAYSGREILKRVTYISRGDSPFGQSLVDDVAVLALGAS